MDWNWLTQHIGWFASLSLSNTVPHGGTPPKVTTLPTTFLAWWGAMLSSVLAIIKIWEIWRDRFRLDIGYSFADESIGNNILIRNLSSRPFILEYWELFYGSSHWPYPKVKSISCAEPDEGDRRVEPHSTCNLHFAHHRHFSWDHTTLEGRKIYIRIFIAGRRPVLRVVYPSTPR
jgi:hypothetical protein